MSARATPHAAPLRAVVVDDETLAREGLAADLVALDVAVVAACADGHAARDAVRRLRPDLLFLDVQMPEVDGFAVLEGLEPDEAPPAVIFVTAHDEHALRAFEARALDYLLKPVPPPRLREAVARGRRRVLEARALRDALVAPEPPAPAHGEGAYLRHLLVRDRDGIGVVPVDALEWVEAEAYYVRLHAAGARPRLLRERMSVLEARLDPARFFRTHRSAIVRLDLVRAVRAVSRYEHVVLLATGARVPLSRDRRPRLEAILAERAGRR